MFEITVDTATTQLHRTNRRELSLLILAPELFGSQWQTLDRLRVELSSVDGALSLQSRVVILNGYVDILGRLGPPEIALEWPTDVGLPTTLIVTVRTN